MASVSGVRGIVGEGLTPQVASLWANGFGTWVGGKKVILARDTRPTGKMFLYCVKAGLMSAGCDVEDIGIVPTPAGALAVERRGAGGGIIITASHNPQEWNALKFVRSDGRMLTADDFKELQSIVEKGFKTVTWNKIGRDLEWNGAFEMYLGAVLGLGLLDLDRIRRKKFRVAIDCVNGAGGKMYPLLLESLGCEVISIHTELSGIFPRPPEPTPENIKQLCQCVKENNCNIGFAVDPDGDRLAAVGENGNPIGEETTLALAILNTLSKRPGPVVINTLTSQLISDIAHQFSVNCFRSMVGEANVASLMKEKGAVVGGEGNGGVMLAELHLVRDAGVGMALILNELAMSRKPLSVRVASLPKYKMIKATYPIEDFSPQFVLDKLAERLKSERIMLFDGVRIIKDNGWIHTRTSNTEPILRIYSEDKDEHQAESDLKKVIENLDFIIKTYN